MGFHFMLILYWTRLGLTFLVEKNNILAINILMYKLLIA